MKGTALTGAELAGLVCTRICHDLVSPVGAIVNGTDLIRELGLAHAEDELAMIEQSAKRAAAVLRFHRLAFGHAGDSAKLMGREELRARISEVLASRRVQIDWSAPDGPPVPVPVARLFCLMMLAARAMLGMNGTLRVTLPSAGALPLAVIAKGKAAAASEDQRRWLSGGAGPDPESREVEFALIGAAAATAGARVELTEDSGQLALRALPG